VTSRDRDASSGWATATEVGAAPGGDEPSRSVTDGPRVVHVDGPAEDEACDRCGARRLSWRKCKLVCANCSHINKSCADL
jgi:hypothetical protein